MSGMHDHAGRLVDHKHIPVLVYNVERDILGYDFKLVARTVHHYLHHIQRFDTVARRLFKPLYQKFVDPEQFLSFIGHEPEMLVIIRTVDFYDPALFGGIRQTGIVGKIQILTVIVGDHSSEPSAGSSIMYDSIAPMLSISSWTGPQPTERVTVDVTGITEPTVSGVSP